MKAIIIIIVIGVLIGTALKFLCKASGKVIDKQIQKSFKDDDKN